MRTSEAGYEAAGARQAGLDRFESGDVDGAVALLREAGAVVDLAHVLHAAGRTDEALAALSEPALSDPEVARLRIAFASALGRFDVAPSPDDWPDDPASLLDIADLALASDHCEQAATAFARLRVVDADDGHRVYAAYGRVEAYGRLGRWRDALDAALEAGRGDRGMLATDLIEHANRRVFGGPVSVMQWEDLAARLAAERAAHRRMHLELA